VQLIPILLPVSTHLKLKFYLSMINGQPIASKINENHGAGHEEI